MSSTIVVFYSDSKYEYQAKGVIESFLLNQYDSQNNFTLVYYTIDFESNLEYENLIKVRIDKKHNLPKFEFYKPTVLLDSISRFNVDNYLFVDVDIIFGKRFSIDKIVNKREYPMLSQGNWDFPFYWFKDINGKETIFNESSLMDYLGVKERSMGYVYTCIISYNQKCREILEEWENLCNNPSLLQNREKFFPFPDETALNVLLWKKNIKENFGRLYLNTLDYEPLVYVEKNEGISGNPDLNYGVFDSDLMRCENSTNILFYHGIKDKETIEKCLTYIKDRILFKK
jgi:hypothetical protein